MHSVIFDQRNQEFEVITRIAKNEFDFFKANILSWFLQKNYDESHDIAHQIAMKRNQRWNRSHWKLNQWSANKVEGTLENLSNIFFLRTWFPWNYIFYFYRVVTTLKNWIISLKSDIYMKLSFASSD